MIGRSHHKTAEKAIGSPSMGIGDDFEAYLTERALEETKQTDQINSNVVTTISTKRPVPETTSVNKAKKRRSKKKSAKTRPKKKKTTTTTNSTQLRLGDDLKTCPLQQALDSTRQPSASYADVIIGETRDTVCDKFKKAAENGEVVVVDD